jgi:hypothetical protein
MGEIDDVTKLNSLSGGVGGVTLARVHNEASKPITVNPNYEPLPVRYRPIDKTVKKFRCCMCGNEWTSQKGNFPSGGNSILWKGNGGYLPFCKSCCESLMENLTAFYSGNEEHALKHLCGIFDWFYDEAASAMTLNQVKSGRSRLSLYPGKAQIRNVKQRGDTYLDNIRADSETSRRVKSVDDAKVVIAKADDEEPFVVTKDMLRRWSTGMAPEEYDFLESEFDDWRNKVEVKTKSQEELIKAICLAQLNVRRAQAAGNSKAVSEAMKSLTDLMANCNLTPRQASEIANSSSTQMCLGQLIKKIEEEEPIGEPSPEFKDPDGIRKYISTFFYGHLAKALHIKNDNQTEYDAEIGKYTVVPPDASESTDNTDDLFSDQSDDEADLVVKQDE